MKFTGRKILGIFLILVIGVLSLRSWQAFFTAMVTPGISDIWQPIVWFSVLSVFFFLGTIAWSHMVLRITGAALIFLPGLLFIRSWEHIAAGIVATLFIFWSSASIARETKERVRFRFFKSARVGQFFFVLGLSLSISSGYYVFLKNASWEELVPRFRIGEEMTGIIFKVAGTINPSFAQLSEGGTTVDEFLLSLGQNKPEEGTIDEGTSEKVMNEQAIENALPELSQYLTGKNASLFSDLDQGKIAEQLFLESGREQVATLVGRPVAGDEKISDILSLAVQNKLIVLLRGGDTAKQVPSQSVPFFLSLLIFLTLLSLASIVAPLYILGAELLFLLAIWLGWLKLGTFTVEQEKLEE
ncbi:MAG: hypothetical protein Q8Q10_04125 [bacterium]|nr:hypothetical protein [bacterium]